MPSKKHKPSQVCTEKPAASWASLPWKKTEAKLQTKHGKRQRDIEDEDTEDNLDHYLNAKNHYDDSDADPDELYDNGHRGGNYIEGQNDPGICFGLEVIDGSAYSVEQISLGKGTGAGGFVKRLVIHDAKVSNEVEKDSEGKRKEIKAKTTEQDGSQVKEIDVNADKDLTQDERVKLKIERKRAKRKEKKLEKLKAKRLEKKLQKKRKREMDNNGEQQQEEVAEETKAKSQTEQIKHPQSNSSSRSTSKEEPQPKKQKTQVKKDVSKDNACPLATESQISTLQTDWCVATGGVYLHPNICASLYASKFHTPMPIQGSTLSASILGKRDIVGAAPTGSGKTLSYILPILQWLYTDRDEREEKIKQYPLMALILCPTRELAMQVSNEFSKLVRAESNGFGAKIQCGVIVGGLAEQKQKRVLDVKRPPVLVGTPGRLWELMSTNEHDHLNDLSLIRFLVIDEADRMISQGSFPQLTSIFERIQEANPPLDNMDDQDSMGSDDIAGEDRLKGLPGIKGESKVIMLTDEMLKMMNQGSDKNEDFKKVPKAMELDDDEFEMEQQKLERLEEENSDFDDEDEERVQRQTFIFSATLTLPKASHVNIGAELSQRRKGKEKMSMDGAIQEILEKAGAQGQTKVVDLSHQKAEKSVSKKNSMNDLPNLNTKPSINLPPGLSLYEVRCTQKHKDSHLYSFLTNTKQGSSGPSLVFCNSIGAVKRVGETLKVLGLPVRTLHAQMQQKSRLSSLESLKGSNSRSVVVATDVAARGLDIPSVASVIHYDVARAIDTFVHRAGRTARGVGTEGWSVSLVAAAEEKSHGSICQAVRGFTSKSFDSVPMDGRLLTSAQERVNLASKVVACEAAETKTNKSNKWFIDAAQDAGLDLDEELLDDGLMGGSKKERQHYIQAKRARQELKELLATPMRTQSYGKFLSGVGFKKAIKIESEIKSFIVTDTSMKKKKKIKKV